MNKKHFSFALVLVVLIATGAVFAQSNATLKGGAYRATFMSGEERIVISNHSGTTKNVAVYTTDGKRVATGTARIIGARVNVDYGDWGFDTWTIVDNETFKDSGGDTYFWVRNTRDGVDRF
jgi:hypothetical protein